jgi:hypothetical protein
MVEKLTLYLKRCVKQVRMLTLIKRLWDLMCRMQGNNFFHHFCLHACASLCMQTFEHYIRPHDMEGIKAHRANP